MSPQERFSEKDFEAIFKEYFPFLCSFAKKYVFDTDACKDIVHNVFLNLWQKQESINLDEPIKPYLFKSVHNRCLNYIRDNKKIVSHELVTDTNEIPSLIESRDYLEESELENRIAKAIAALPEKCGRIFHLSRFEGKKYAEIAKIENLSIKAIEAQMSKALKLLREDLKDHLILFCLFIQIILGL